VSRHSLRSSLNGHRALSRWYVEYVLGESARYGLGISSNMASRLVGSMLHLEIKINPDLFLWKVWSMVRYWYDVSSILGSNPGLDYANTHLGYAWGIDEIYNLGLVCY
jgi:hypothetical protein